MQHDVVHRADLPGPQQLHGARVVGVVHHHVVHSQAQPQPAGQHYQAAGVHQARGHGLLHQHVLAGLQSPLGQRGVAGIVGGDEHRLHLTVPQHGLHPVVPAQAEGLGFGAPRAVLVGDPEQGRGRIRPEAPPVQAEAFPRDAAAGDAAEPEQSIVDAHD